MNRDEAIRVLKPCPFCGGEAVLETIRVRKGDEAVVHCNGGCLASIHTITYDTEQEAIDAATEAWNRRAPRKEATNDP